MELEKERDVDSGRESLLQGIWRTVMDGVSVREICLWTFCNKRIVISK